MSPRKVVIIGYGMAGTRLAEELRRMDPDYVYADSLAAATGVTGLDRRPSTRTHVWRDPAWSESS